MMAPYANAFGLLLTLAGVLMLFRYGMPYQVRTSGNVTRVIQPTSAAKKDAVHDRAGKFGLAAVVVGTLIQMIAGFLP